LTEGNIRIFALIFACLNEANTRFVLKYLADFALADVVLAFEFIRVENINSHNVHAASISWRQIRVNQLPTASN
jgi:hypothetical protein